MWHLYSGLTFPRPGQAGTDLSGRGAPRSQLGLEEMDAGESWLSVPGTSVVMLVVFILDGLAPRLLLPKHAMPCSLVALPLPSLISSARGVRRLPRTHCTHLHHHFHAPLPLCTFCPLFTFLFLTHLHWCHVRQGFSPGLHRDPLFPQ